MAIELIKINEFPQVSEPGDWIVVSDAAGTGYKISKEDFKEWLGTVTVITDKPIALADPAPTLDGVYLPTEPGTYTNAGGLVYDPNGVDSGKYVQFIKNDTVWTKLEVDLPQAENKIPDWEAGTYNQGDQRIWNGQIWSVDVASTTEEPGVGTDWVADTDKPAPVIDNLDTPDPDAALSAKQGVEMKPRILPEGNEFERIDRPDLDPIYDVIEVDEQGKILESNNLKKVIAENVIDRPDLKSVLVDKNNKIISQDRAGIIGDDLNKLISVDTIDRPDLALAFLDKHNKIISQIKPQPAYTPDEVSGYISQYFNPAPQEAFAMNEDYLIDYDLLIGKWESLRSSANINPNIDPYITRTNKGKSSTKDLDIWRYDFIPRNPTMKFALTTGMHASEKVYIKLLLDFMTLITEKWYTSPMLTWLRHNVHFIILPCVSPSALTGYAEGSNGGRRVHETEDIPVSWTKSGTTVTVTYDLADFPNTDGRLDAATYFSNPNIVGKTQVSLFDSSDAGLPDNGYVIESVVDGNTITVEVPESGGASSGTANMYVSVDINRNFQAEGSTVWNNYTPSVTVKPMYSNERVQVGNDNKGTAPHSLSETRILKELIDTEEIAFIFDCHSGAGRNYLHNNTSNPVGYIEAIEEIKYFVGQFTPYDFSRVTMDNPNTPYMNTYIMETKGKQGYTIEWLQPSGVDGVADIQEATDAFRWLITTVSVLAQISKIK